MFEALKEKLGHLFEGFTLQPSKMRISLISKDSLIETVRHCVEDLKLRFLFLFATDDRQDKKCFRIHYLFSDVQESQFLVLEIKVSEKDTTFPSIAEHFPQAVWQEREVQDMFGLKAVGLLDTRPLVLHEDWPRDLFPLRKDFAPSAQIPRVKGEYAFDRVEGEGVFEIPVGPVHAGIIEPGHFRFSVAGESILKLEIRHFYTHKGTEKLGEGKDPHALIHLAERISGDNSTAHAAACAEAIERLAGIEIPRRVKYLRVVLLEMERIWNHLGDIAGISLDVAFSVGATQLMKIREGLFGLNDYLTGSRFLRGVVIPGGVQENDFQNKKEFLLKELRRFKSDFDKTTQILWSVNSFRDRVKTTGIIKKEIADALGATGPIARASGIDRDLRRDHPYAAYGEFLFMTPVFKDGDVESRMQVKIREIYESFKLIHDACEAMPDGPSRIDIPSLPHTKSALGYVESSRGECYHWVETDKDGRISRWKIHSPSFSNWPLIEHAVLENIVPDFPLINKSMNLSYSGCDR